MHLRARRSDDRCTNLALVRQRLLVSAKAGMIAEHRTDAIKQQPAADHARCRRQKPRPALLGAQNPEGPRKQWLGDHFPFDKGFSDLFFDAKQKRYRDPTGTTISYAERSAWQSFRLLITRLTNGKCTERRERSAKAAVSMPTGNTSIRIVRSARTKLKSWLCRPHSRVR